MMSEVLLSYGNRVERIPVSDGETEATLEKKLAETFQIPNISEFFGIQDPQTRRVFSLQEILAAPFLFRSQVGTVIIGCSSCVECVTFRSFSNFSATTDNSDCRNSVKL